MRITKAEIERYRSQIKSRENDAKAYLVARIRQEAEGLSIADAREATIEIMRDCLAVFGDQAQEISASFFDELSEAGEFDAGAAEMFDGIIDDGMMQEKVRYYAGKLRDGDWDGYAGSNADLAAFYVHRSAFQNMERNCYKNHVRYARVGTGRETCGFCFMLSTRGFDYRSKDTASAASHIHCDCIIVPGAKGKTKIAGYEPEKMYERWKSCQETLGGDEGLRVRFQELSDEELGKVKGRNVGEKWLKWRNTQISKEVESRDSAWLYRGIEPKYTQEDGARPEEREKKTASLLSKHGLKLEFRKTRENVDGGLRTSDCFLITGFGKDEKLMPIEFKQPKGSGKNNIYNQFNEASGQAKKLVIDATRSPFTFDEVCEKALEGLKRRKDFTDVYVIDESRMRHYEKAA